MSAAIYLVVCMLMWGLAVFAMKVAGQRLDPITVAVFNIFGYLAAGLFLFSRATFGLTKYHLLGVAIGAMFVAGNMAFYKLSQTVQVSALVPLTSLYVILPVLLGFLVLGEPLSLRKGLGIFLALVAVYLLSTVDKPA